MKRKILMAIVYCFAAFGMLSAYQQCSTFITIDKCLDRSGAWDYQKEICDGGRED